MSTILIVEDNEKNMKLLRDVLTFKGHTVLEAVDGETGVALGLSALPDLVLMDIQLPGINGVEALKQLRADARTAHIPIIAVTASVMDQDRRVIIDAGFNGFVSKPVNLKEFMAAVDKSLEGGA